MASTTSPNMGLTIPSVGLEPGPAWASDINVSLSVIDAHTHSPGAGLPITPAGLNLNADVSIQTHNLTNVGNVQLSPQGSLVSGSITNCLYAANQGSSSSLYDLYFNDGSGHQIPITKSGIINATATSISGESYASGTFIWKKFDVGGTPPADFDVGSVILRNNVAGTTNGIVLSARAGLTGTTNFILPTPPASTLPLKMDNTGALTATQIVAADLSTAAVQSLLPPGVMMPFAGSAVPIGWLSCDGSAINRTTFAALFAAIGTAYGAGNGSTTFNIPDCRGRTAIGAGTGSGLTARTIGQSLGEENHALSVAELAAHAHGLTDPGHTHTERGDLSLGTSNSILQLGQADVTTNTVTTNATGSAVTGISMASVGSGTAHNTMQPSIVALYIIKT